MIKTIKAAAVWILAALVCITLLSFNSMAASAVDSSIIGADKQGPLAGTDSSGTSSAATSVIYSGTAVSNNETYTVEASASGENAEVTDAPMGEYTPNYTVEGTGDDAVYTFEGKQYKAGEFYGTQKLTGYSPEENGSAMTSSGVTAKAKHTVAAASDLPIGTVIIVKGSSGPYSSDYDGLYVVEDRGGAGIEAERKIDIFFDTYAEAIRITDAGWNYADVWIAELVE